MNATFNPATDRIIGVSHDNNGNVLGTTVRRMTLRTGRRRGTGRRVMGTLRIIGGFGGGNVR